LTASELRERLIDSITLLTIPGVGRARFRALVQKLGSPGAVLAASVGDLEIIPGISRTIAAAIKNQAEPIEAGKICSQIAKYGWTVIFPESPEYPTPLAAVDDAPPLLFRLGEAWREGDRLIAIVGTRRPTERGRLLAYNLAGDLARAGIVVVSGMADGVDASAHYGAIEAGGRTVAIWGTSMEIVYPSGNRKLSHQIAKQGAIYSEYLPGTGPEKGYFPERNRIIAGMSEGVVVVEAGLKSGALITAELAIEQGRELFAVPGWPDQPMSFGTNWLLKKGARLLTGIGDIFDELPRLAGAVAARQFEATPDLTDSERQLVKLLSEEPLNIDQLSRKSGVPVSDLLEYLLAMELKGVVQELSGKRFILNAQHS
jgi:DNA processing protein